MSKTTDIAGIATIISSVAAIIKGNPENKEFRLSKKVRRNSRKELNRAQKDLEDLKDRLSHDADGFTEKDKTLIKELEEHLIKATADLIRIDF